MHLYYYIYMYYRYTSLLFMLSYPLVGSGSLYSGFPSRRSMSSTALSRRHADTPLDSEFLKLNLRDGSPESDSNFFFFPIVRARSASDFPITCPVKTVTCPITWRSAGTSLALLPALLPALHLPFNFPIQNRNCLYMHLQRCR